jgi:hypothetical protein
MTRAEIEAVAESQYGDREQPLFNLLVDVAGAYLEHLKERAVEVGNDEELADELGYEPDEADPFLGCTPMEALLAEIEANLEMREKGITKGPGNPPG